MIGRTLFYFMGKYSSKGVCPPFPTQSFFCGGWFFLAVVILEVVGEHCTFGSFLFLNQWQVTAVYERT